MRKAWQGLSIVAAMALSAPAAFAQDEAERFAELHQQLQQKTAEAQQIRADYTSADDADQQEALAEQFAELVGELEALMPELADATVDAYAAAPNEDDQVTETLATVARSLIARDRYEPARPATRLMVEHDHPDSERYALAGVAAYAVGDFDDAAAYFDQAEEAGAMTQLAAKFAPSAEDYQEYAEEERSIREAEAEADDLPRVKFRTSEGDMVIELFEDHAPNTVANFISLVEDDYYDGLTFHRVLPNFMAQGGCPDGTGAGGPGYAIPCELDGDYRRHFRGTLSMAHAGEDTGGSQFFLTFVPTSHLNGLHTAFGRVIEGMDVLPKLERVDPRRPQAGIEPSRIIEASVIRKRDHDYEPETLPSPR